MKYLLSFFLIFTFIKVDYSLSQHESSNTAKLADGMAMNQIAYD